MFEASPNRFLLTSIAVWNIKDRNMTVCVIKQVVNQSRFAAANDDDRRREIETPPTLSA